MQTFIPFGSDFTASAQAIGSLRLNKQLLECRQLLNIIAGNSTGYAKHPAVLMWWDSPEYLYNYTVEIIKEMKYRGIRYTKNWNAIWDIISDMDTPGGDFPEWLNDSRVADSHKFNLWRKDPTYYAEFAGSPNEVCCPNGSKKNKKPCSYFWPSHLTDNRNIF